MNGSQLSLFGLPNGQLPAPEEAPPVSDESHLDHRSVAILRRLGIPDDSMPNPDNRDAVLKSMLEKKLKAL
jgi:hypothetical protein